jgi:NAD(P)-dependent dehydrogenase (short-subunit alcohol dehydrogenase family)
LTGTSKVIVITGASDGIGAAAARSLAQAGHQVVLAGRSPGKTNRVAAELEADSHVADFADLGAVRALAAALQAKYPRIDVLANNAGGVSSARSRQVTGDGHERTFQVNYLAPFLDRHYRSQGLAAPLPSFTRPPGPQRTGRWRLGGNA